jgi:hypothetical protein
VIADPGDPDPTSRYKLLMRPERRNVTNMVVGYLSADGINWRLARPQPLIAVDSDCHVGLYRDPGTGLYQASFRAHNLDRRVWRKRSGNMDVQLAHSRDGYCWHRTAVGQRLIGLGEPGTWEGGNVIPSTAPVLLDDCGYPHPPACPGPAG